MTDSYLIAACDRVLASTNAGDHALVATTLRSILAARVIPRKGPRMSDTAESRPDPGAQIELWLKQYLEHAQCPDLAGKVNLALVFRLTRTMFLQGKQLEDVHAIIIDMANSKSKPKSIGYLITVIEGGLGKVA